MNLLSNTNSKLGKKVFNFNLPLLTCKKFRTTTCYQLCYAKHGAYTFPSNKTHFEMLLFLSQTNKFVSWINEEIERRKVKYLRIHSSGDFYSQTYFNKWCEIARLNPQTRILAFTRNFSLDISKRPENLVLYFSIDQTTIIRNNDFTLFATLIPPTKPIVQYGHFEKHKYGRICRSKCASCKACFYGKVNVVFLQRWQGARFTPKGTRDKPGLRKFGDKERNSRKQQKLQVISHDNRAV